MRLTIGAALVAACALPAGVVTAASPADDTIDLPAGFAAEGVTVGRGDTFYAGSRADGRIARGDVSDRVAEVWVADAAVSPAVGMKADVPHGLLWVAGGPTGRAAVYALDSAEAIVSPTLTTEPSFINDVVATRDAAYFTNSLQPELYRVPVSSRGDVGTPEVVELSGPAAEFVTGFNLNGITATSDGKTLIVVNSAKGELYTVDAATGSSALIDIGGTTVRTGDGILLSGRTLYVLQNGNAPGVPNQVVVIRLAGDLSSGQVVDTLSSTSFETATTLAKHGHVLLAVNAQFAGSPIDERAEVVLLPAR